MPRYARGGGQDDWLFPVFAEGVCPHCGGAVTLKVPPPIPPPETLHAQHQGEHARKLLAAKATPTGCYRTKSVAGPCSECGTEIARVGKGYAHIDLNKIGEFPDCQECCPLCKLDPRNARSQPAAPTQTR
jgi:hypothetical protein